MNYFREGHGRCSVLHCLVQSLTSAQIDQYDARIWCRTYPKGAVTYSRSGLNLGIAFWEFANFRKFCAHRERMWQNFFGKLKQCPTDQS